MGLLCHVSLREENVNTQIDKTTNRPCLKKVSEDVCRVGGWGVMETGLMQAVTVAHA